jgi:hypothetical protein
MNNSKAMDDNYLDYFAVIESSVENPDTKILSQINNNGLSYLRFSQCLQSFGKRNRNRRLWTSDIMKKMLAEKHVYEMFQHGGIPSESGHPVPDVGQPTIERIMTIDPDNTVSVTKSIEWRGELLYGTIETLDDGPSGKGTKFMKNILQGLDPAYSLRSLVPQRKNSDGTIDVTGCGRFITWDRVFVPSHEEAYIDKTIPLKNIITKPQFQTVMEGFTDFVLEHSNKVNQIIDTLDPVMESANIDKNGLLSIDTKEAGKLFIFPENKYRKEISSFFKKL